MEGVQLYNFRFMNNLGEASQEVRHLTRAEIDHVMKLLDDWSEGEGLEFLSSYAKRVTKGQANTMEWRSKEIN